MTSVERAVQFANPVTGEVLHLGSPDVDLGRYLADLREFESVLREHKKMVQRELLSRMDRRAEWTAHLEGGLKLTGQSPKLQEDWDGAALKSALMSLVDEGVLAVEAVDAAVETEISFKVKKAGINRLRKLGGRVAETIDSLCMQHEPDRRVSVSR